MKEGNGCGKSRGGRTGQLFTALETFMDFGDKDVQRWGVSLPPRNSLITKGSREALKSKAQETLGTANLPEFFQQTSAGSAPTPGLQRNRSYQKEVYNICLV